MVRILSEPLLKYRISVKEGRDTRQITLNSLKVLEKQKLLGPVDEAILRQARGNCLVSIGKAFLDQNDRRGIAFFRRGLIAAHDWHQKFRAAGGIFLFSIPLTLRKKMFDLIYSFTNGET